MLHFNLFSFVLESEGTSGARVITRRLLFDKMQSQIRMSFDKKLMYLETYILSQEQYNGDEIKELKPKISHLKAHFKERWENAHRKAELFLKKYDTWLQGTFKIPRAKRRRSSGRPTKSFEESSERSKRRKTEDVRGVVDNDVLIAAAQTSLQNTGQRLASSILKDITNSPQTAQSYHEAYKMCEQSKNQAQSAQLDLTAALSMFVEADLSRRQYNLIRDTNKKFYPSYKLLQQAKQSCYPAKEAYRVTESCAEINLQDLLDHTAKRLVLYLEDVLKQLTPKEQQSLTLISKWGCDGSQQAQFKQKMQNEDANDSNIFQSSFVPLQLICATKKKVVWQNPTPSSSRYCRPIRIRFIKESINITNSEINYIENALNSLQNTAFEQGGIPLSIKHVMTLTMVDAKVCNAATSTSSTMRCYICGATSKQFNDLNTRNTVDTDALEFGLSVLHARIRFLESILHLAYKIPVKKWQLRSASDKEIVKQKKKEIQKKFKEQLGLIIDVPKAEFGNTNDGNTSRRFFSNPEVAAEITGVDFNLINRLKVILEVLTSGYKVDLKKISDYAYETAELYVRLYSWHPMTPTMHKILIHGATVMEKALLPIGLLSEEAAEARNKHFRSYRQNYARKFSREQCNMDVLNRLLLSSDPYITSIRQKPKKRSTSHSKEAMQMFISAEPNTINESLSEESSEESADEFMQ